MEPLTAPNVIAAKRPLLIAYFPLGDPEAQVDLLDAYVEAGVDFLEFGWPATNPYLDGPDVRSSMARALRGSPLLALTEAKRRLAAHPRKPRALLMTYAEAGRPYLDDTEIFRDLDAILVVGEPREASRQRLEAGARRAQVAVCAFVSLPLDEEQIAAARQADGYVMLQAATGVTGPRPTLDLGNAERIARLRAEGVTAPIVLGFGVSRGEHARAAMELGADGIVVGSAALRAAGVGSLALKALLRDLRNGLDG